MKVIVFPLDNYVRPLIEYEKLWHFEICVLYRQWVLELIICRCMKMIKSILLKSEMSEDNMAEMEALLVVESYHFVKLN